MTLKKFKVYVMCCLPGSGKDTYINSHLKDVPQVCRDLIRTEIGLKGEKPYGDTIQEQLVTEISRTKMKQYCEKETTFVVNETNHKKEYRNNIIDLITHITHI